MMHWVDHSILEFCRNDFRPLKPLRSRIPVGSLYRHAKRLLQLGWLRTENGLYRTTEAGLRQLAEAGSGQQWDDLVRLYPPLGLVPTPVHRCMIELIFAAIVARQHATRDDRHPFFVCFGGTFHWKTSLGRFVCRALGLDPAIHVVECGSETGKSLSFRRSGTGTLTSKRELLDTPFLTLDEFLAADPSVRSTLNVFLSGRLLMPFENEQLTVRPVPLLTLNPRAKPTLEGRIGLSAPQIRRAILADLDAVPMPDLATTGERALVAAREADPLALSKPAADCQSFHKAIVELTRAILLPEAHERVDVEVVVNLCTGMTSFLLKPAEAIAHVIHALGVLAETTGWARPGWIQAVTGFALEPQRAQTSPSAATLLPARPGATAEPAAIESGSPPPTSIALVVPRPPRRGAEVPELTLGDHERARLIWFAMETQLPLARAINLLMNFYLNLRRQGRTLTTCQAILDLARQLEVTGISAEDLHGYFNAEENLAKYSCSFEDVPEALRVLELLGNLPHEWNWPQAQAAMQAVATVLTAGISADQVASFLAQHQRLTELGFDEDTAEAIAGALRRAGVTGERQDAVLDAMVIVATSEVDRAELEQKRQRLQADVAALDTYRLKLLRAVKVMKTRLEHLAREEANARERKQQVDTECAAQSFGLAALRGLRALLLRKTPEVDLFLADVERLSQWRRSGRSPGDAYATLLTDRLREKIVDFFKQLVEELQGS